MTTKTRIAFLAVTMFAALSVATTTLVDSADAETTTLNGITYNVIDCTGGVCYGTTDNDLMRGTSGTDYIFGYGGHDKIFGYGGDDYLYGNAGNDIIDAGNGDDYVMGALGDDVLEGDAGDDTIFGEGGNDTIEGEGGDDTLYGGNGDDYIVGGDGADTIYGQAGDDHLIAATGHHPGDSSIDDIYCDDDSTQDPTYTDNRVYYTVASTTEDVVADTITSCTNDDQYNDVS